MNEIVLSYGKVRREIAQQFEVSVVTVRNALKGRTNSYLSRQIREVAKQKGGYELNKNT